MISFSVSDSTLYLLSGMVEDGAKDGPLEPQIGWSGEDMLTNNQNITAGYEISADRKQLSLHTLLPAFCWKTLIIHLDLR